MAVGIERTVLVVVARPLVAWALVIATIWAFPSGSWGLAMVNSTGLTIILLAVPLVWAFLVTAAVIVLSIAIGPAVVSVSVIV